MVWINACSLCIAFQGGTVKISHVMSSVTPPPLAFTKHRGGHVLCLVKSIVHGWHNTVKLHSRTLKSLGAPWANSMLEVKGEWMWPPQQTNMQDFADIEWNPFFSERHGSHTEKSISTQPPRCLTVGAASLFSPSIPLVFVAKELGPKSSASF